MKTYPLLDLLNILLMGLQEITALIDPLLVQSMNTSGKSLNEVSRQKAKKVRKACKFQTAFAGPTSTTAITVMSNMMSLLTLKILWRTQCTLQ